MDEKKASHIEDIRQIEHLAPVAFAFLLPYLPYWLILVLSVSALFHALYISPQLVRVTTRPEEVEKGFSPGKLTYALSVLGLLILFRERLYIAASVWGILAVGDSVSNLIGRRVHGCLIPYNPKKTWAGFFAFWFLGGLAGWVLLIWNLPANPTHEPGTLLGFACLTALFCALGESLPDILDDNLTVAWIGAASYLLLFSAVGPPLWAASLPVALAVNGAAAAAARTLGWLSWRGTLLAVIFGVLILTAMGAPGYAVMATFLVLGSLATRAGFEKKKRLAVAEGSAGERGISNILANGAVPLVLACFHPWIHESNLRIAYCAAVATAAFDTVSTEIGQWLGRHPFSPLTLRKVLVGTRGAISAEGTAAGTVAALAIAGVATGFRWVDPLDSLFICIGAFLGNLFESLLGSRLRDDLQHADESLNLFSTLAGAVSAVTLRHYLG